MEGVEYVTQNASAQSRGEKAEPWTYELDIQKEQDVRAFAVYLEQKLTASILTEEQIKEVTERVDQLNIYADFLAASRADGNPLDEKRVQDRVLEKFCDEDLILKEDSKQNISSSTPASKEEKDCIEQIYGAAEKPKRAAYFGKKRLVNVKRGNEIRDVWLCVRAELNHDFTLSKITDEKVIIKRMLKYDERQRREFIAQGLLTKFYHDCTSVAPLLKIYETDQVIISVSRAADQDLLEFLKSSPFVKLGLREKLCLFKKCLLCVSTVHTLDLAHRDISLENFVLKTGEDGVNVELIDFGQVGKRRETFTGLCGKQGYLAPEIYGFAKGDEFDARKLDVFSLGVCFYAILFLEMPFGQNLTSDKMDLNSLANVNMDPRLKFLLMKMLAKDPKERCTVDEILNFLAHSGL
eukprot:maker-scaffold_33-snap-gene-2.5-mRNA-1 protein AED:0.00 eAED:0.00 QI:358/1/1/1/0/0/2/55/408